jgi:hypothetical protein
MKEIMVPKIDEIATMSRMRCQCERTRLRNEISFARGNALWGGPSSREQEVVVYKRAIAAINGRLSELMNIQLEESTLGESTGSADTVAASAAAGE